MAELAIIDENGTVTNRIIGEGGFQNGVVCAAEVAIGWTYTEGVFTAPPELIPPRDIEAGISAHKLALKIGIVNATRTDGLTDEVTPEAFNLIVERYTKIINEFNTDMNLGDPVSDERKATVRLIRNGQTIFDVVDAAGATILAAGDAADPIETDPRWPALPSA